MSATVGLAAAGAIFWFILFSPWTAGAVNFWGGMAMAAGCLTAGSLAFASAEKPPLLGGIAWTPREAFSFKLSHLWIGLAAAAFLYAVFFIGDRVSSLLFDFAKPQVSGIYNTKAQASPRLIGALLFFWIGPAEEIFWRGFVQRRFSDRFGPLKGFIFSTLIYALIHVWSFNFMLVMAALICGVFWGLLYWQFRSVWPGVISHAVWDLTIFILLPIR